MRSRSQKGTVILVALSCVTVLGIVLASFLAVSNQAMKLSNRAYAKEVSKHLAEMGLERALRSFYDSVPFSSWTLSGTTAKLTLTTVSSPHLPLTYGNSGITPVVNLRVDHYNATVWSAAATTYTTNSMVWYRGIWFQCINGTGIANRVPPNATYWTSAPAAWSSDANYNVNDIALVGGMRYVCSLANASQSPPNATYWSAGSSVVAWSAATSYVANNVALLGGTAYRCIAANSNQTPPNATYWVSAPVIYAEGVATLPDSTSTTIKTQLHATIAPASLFPNAIAATNLVNLASGGTVDSYNSASGIYGGSNIGSSAVLAGGNTSGTAVTVTSARVNGYVAAPSDSTSPYAPLWSYGGSAIVTATPAPTIPATKIDLTRVSRSPFIPQFDIQPVPGAVNLPTGNTFLPDGAYALGAAGTAGTANPPRVYNVTRTYTQAGSYYSGLYLQDTVDVLTINGPVILNVTGSYFGMANGKIVINAGGSLEIYFSTATEMYLGTYDTLGTGGIDNKTLDPSKCFIASNHATNSVDFHSLQPQPTLPFYGTIYMPNAYLTVGSNNVPMYGALSAKNITFTSNANLQYDTALRTGGKIGTFFDAVPYKITEWRELTDASERVILP